MHIASRPTRVLPTSVAHVAEALGPFLLSDASVTDAVVTGITLDSRQVQPGDLYAALPGANVHGARFAAAACASGAAAILTDPAGAELIGDAPVPVLVCDAPRSQMGTLSALIYGQPSSRLTLVGLTGTNGKTTTAAILDAALRELGTTTGCIGTVGISVGQHTLPAVRTTPEATELHALFAVMVEHAVTHCTMEVSSHALTQHRVDAVVYDVAGFLNLTQDHLDYHGDIRSYFEAKAQLFTPERARKAVICVDDVWGKELAARCPLPTTTVSMDPASGADWTIYGEPHDSHFTITSEHTSLTLVSHLAGLYNRVNTAMAAVIMLTAGFSADDVVRGLAAPPHAPGRMQGVDLGEGAPRVVVDFAHTADAVENALRTLRPSTEGLLVAVLGAGGDRDAGKRPLMGAAATAVADLTIITDDNPRSEDPAAIRAAVLGGCAASAQVVEVGDRAQAIATALREAGPTGTVVVLGKGHEQGQEVAGVVTPFDDVAVVRAAWQRIAGEEA